MAVKKTKSSPKKDAAAPKKAASVKGAAKKETAPKKASAAAPAPAAKKEKAPKKAAAPKAAAAPKKAPKKATAPKLTSAQAELLKTVGGAGEAGYLSAKKAEARTLEALRERKLIKKGAKDKASGNFHYIITSTGKKHLDTPAPAAPAAPSGGA